MEKTITGNQLDELQFALQDVIDEMLQDNNLNAGLIRVYNMKSESEGIEFGVNWAALGTVNVKDAMNFNKVLGEALNRVQGINELYKDVKIVY